MRMKIISVDGEGRRKDEEENDEKKRWRRKKEKGMEKTEEAEVTEVRVTDVVVKVEEEKTGLVTMGIDAVVGVETQIAVGVAINAGKQWRRNHARKWKRKRKEREPGKATMTTTWRRPWKEAVLEAKIGEEEKEEVEEEEKMGEE